MANERSRREILAASAALAGGAGAALLASCGGREARSKPVETVSDAQIQSDAAIAATLLDLEEAAIAAYAAAAGRLRGDALATARGFEAHEREHAAALRSSLASLGEPAGPPKPPADFRATFPPLTDAHSALSFVLDIETTSIGAYADALGKVASEPLRVTLAAILATESEHAAVVRGRLGRQQVPAAFVTGEPPELES